MQITTRIKKIIQSNILFVKTKINSFKLMKVLTFIRVKCKNYGTFMQNGYKKNTCESSNDDVYATYEANHSRGRENTKYRTARVIFQERINKRAFVKGLFRLPLSLFKSRKNHLKAMYATKNGYKTCDYSQNKGFYNF